MAAKRGKRIKRAGRIVVEHRSEREGVYQRELVKCGKKRCRCRARPCHGPYWYLYQWQPSKSPRGGKLRSVYIGKKLKRRLA